MDLDWCLACGKQLDDDKLYCSLECQYFDSSPEHRHHRIESVSHPRWPPLGVGNVHARVARVPLEAAHCGTPPREDARFLINNTLTVRTIPGVRVSSLPYRAPRLLQPVSSVPASLTKPSSDQISASISTCSKIRSSQELLATIFHSQRSENTAKGSLSRLPARLPSVVLATDDPCGKWGIGRRLMASRSLPSQSQDRLSSHAEETGFAQRSSWTSSSHTLSESNTQSTSSTLVEPVFQIGKQVPNLAAKITEELPEETQVISTTTGYNDHSAPASGGLFSHSHHFVMPNANMYSIGTQHHHYHGHVNVLERSAKYIMPGAELDSSLREYPPRCHPGTRSNILSSIQKFIHDDVRMIWITGPAGVGKSAIMQTLAEGEIKNHLRVAIFLSKKDGINDARRIFSSIAYQLATQNKNYLTYLEDKFGGDPLFMEKSLPAQFQILVVTPFIQKCVPPLYSERCVICIDALDESRDERDQCQVLQLIYNFVRFHPTIPVTWVLATRPRPYLISFFAQVKRTTKSVRECRLVIHSERARHDVECYLEAEFRRIKDNFPELIPPPSPWPAKNHFYLITSASSGFFAFANAVIHFVNKPTGNPVSRLSCVIAALDNRFGLKVLSENPFRTLDSTYSQIMSDIPVDALPHIKFLLGYYFSPINSPASQAPLLLACSLLGLECDLDNILRSLLPVLIPPLPSHMHVQGLQFLHTSFVDYLGDQDRSGTYWIDINDILTKVWRRCACILLQWSELHSSELIQISWPPDTSTSIESSHQFRDEIFRKASLLWTDLLYGYCHRWCSAKCNMKLETRYSLTVSVVDILDMLRQINYQHPTIFGEDPVYMAKFLSWLLEHAPIELRKQVVLQEFRLSKLDKARFFKALCEKKWYRGVTETYQHFKIECGSNCLAAIQELRVSEWFTAEATLASIDGSLGELVRMLQGVNSPNCIIVTVLGTDSTNCCGLVRHQKSPQLLQYHIFPYADSYSHSTSLTMCSLD